MKTRDGEIPPASSAARWLDHCEVDDATRLARDLDTSVPDAHAIPAPRELPKNPIPGSVFPSYSPAVFREQVSGKQPAKSLILIGRWWARQGSNL
ncbi:hypothetical protein [Bradyrhizobium lablabi]|uniref:hypothetical protein n=1 Tax=Bradyrhizobium lablabi TaxID=722472 RepID=UPI0012E3AE8B|nr:hypothetical protein [Bradyrhizobium lablabi]